jgi:type IV pilus assembly protein PilQ
VLKKLKSPLNKLFSLIVMVVAFSSLSACDKWMEKKGETPIDNNNLIDSELMFDRQKFIDQSKERSRREAAFGPEMLDFDSPNLRANSRTFINREETMDTVDIEEGFADRDYEVSFNSENLDIRIFSELLARATGVNIIVSDEVEGDVSTTLKKVPWTKLLDNVLQIKSLAKHVDGRSNIIRIHGQNKIVELEEFEKKRQENLQRSLQLKRAAEPLYTEIFKLYYTKPSDVKKTIDGTIAAGQTAQADGIRSIRPEITVDERKNLIIVKARKADMSLVSKLVRELDTRTQQVFIEAFIVEVKDDFASAFGTRVGLNVEDTFRNDNRLYYGRLTGVGGTPAGVVTPGDTGASLSNLPVANPTGGIGILAGIGSTADLKLELTAMEREGMSKVVSNPKIFTLDNKEAVIFQGTEVPYESSSANEGTKVEFKQAGLRLAVTPTIVGDGTLQLGLTVNKDTVDTTQTNPPIAKSEIKTNLISKDGSIVVIGGIYTEEQDNTMDKVPGVAEVPLFGNLFKRKVKGSGKNELIIFIAPKVL